MDLCLFFETHMFAAMGHLPVNSYVPHCWTEYFRTAITYLKIEIKQKKSPSLSRIPLPFTVSRKNSLINLHSFSLHTHMPESCLSSLSEAPLIYSILNPLKPGFCPLQPPEAVLASLQWSLLHHIAEPVLHCHWTVPAFSRDHPSPSWILLTFPGSLISPQWMLPLHLSEEVFQGPSLCPFLYLTTELVCPRLQTELPSLLQTCPFHQN